MRRVSIIQRVIPHYRVRFFEELYAQGKLRGLDIQIYAGAPPPASALSPTFPYHVLPICYLGRKKTNPCWMKTLEKAIEGSDVVVAPQELQCLTVPFMWAKRRRVCGSWIWWGHGYDTRASAGVSATSWLREAIKGFMTRRADGLITYTPGGADYWRKKGLPANRLVPCYNTIDVEGLRAAGADATKAQLMELRSSLGLEGKRVLLFSGRLYAEKQVEFLLEAFALLKKTDLDVALLIVGDGEDRDRLEQLARRAELEDVHFLGELTDPKVTAAYFSLAELMVIPGLVGLAVVHGFAFGLPLVTTEHNFHSVEIEYLSGDNGVMTKHNVSRYAEAIAALLLDPQRLEVMRASARDKGDELQLPLSVRRFVEGINTLSRG